MRLHLVTIPAEANAEADDNPRPIRQFCGTGAEATALRMKWWDDGLSFKKSDITIEQIDVPTDKAGLLAYLNSLVGG